MDIFHKSWQMNKNIYLSYSHIIYIIFIMEHILPLKIDNFNVDIERIVRANLVMKCLLAKMQLD